MSCFRNLIFPLVLAMILCGLSAWLGRVSEVIVEEVKLDPAKPQYSMTNTQGKRFDISGSLKEQLDSPHAWQLPDQKNVFFQSPTLQLFNQGVKQYQVDAEQARYEIETKKVFLQQDVVLTKEADEQRPAAKVTTDHLNVDTVTEIAETDAPIQYQYGRSTGSSVGMTYDNQKGLLSLLSRVRAMIYDTK
ncbi:LPS export ABC transporter periplasmic protein LptC [Kingella negevensis]|uniref:LPS export ABC transporter periplasmic protein LptC n=1 Tax=Kingella negevensis TaxID=1522312 RepID=UPI0025503058|nr:LPS export ABC transporter periplasmic protein LptC [Kingella negevensis]MDK4681033.1 LPS export ABC transporter periplasmic protein LptC [Kingella negevensis]MDK4683235.1 LPS export ABC transporter periplasmic protein LptC [Kingella negevensis]MDK4691633.1 LPS export ABC transporter periplasmic protein LptC [Kingella negevensis]MDK4693216.1 LPS export ABC transporter periplasmic protein LptC [Kingella negevensis]MDK4699516.1 LPS export ABC transporter periplasmic protein LptC [Kingella neg